MLITMSTQTGPMAISPRLILSSVSLFPVVIVTGRLLSSLIAAGQDASAAWS